VRTNILGDCLCNIYAFQGYDAIRANLVNDRGVHICKSMLAYQKFGNDETPESSGMKGDHLIGKYYVLYQQKLSEHPELEEEAKEMLKKWEQGDPQVMELWKKMRAWCMQGFEETYKKEGVHFDKIYYESEFWKKARDYVLECYKKGIFKKGEEGELYIDLEKEGLPNKTVLRSDGTSLYATQDIYLAQLKFSDYDLDKSIYVVAREQEMYFKQLFTILKVMGFEWWNRCIHYSYGMVNLPEGKMKSREGTVVDADDLLLEMEDLAREEILKRNPDLKEEEIHERAHNIGLAALRFYLLKIDANKDIIFNPKEAIPFEGDTGPYVQYTHARTCSILKKAKESDITPAEIDYTVLKEPIERILAQKLSEFPEAASNSCKQMKPHIIAQYLIELSRSFNEFYQTCPCLKAEPGLRDARLKIIESVKTVIKNALSLLGIAALEEM
ncbi:MAG TPA: arginine--tRNA ligase, partial [Candidatus Woesearchaeota archaeon]|nr:arginine--tRNA ligase [Candidatus Woesearchaeota archaeon]